MGSSETSQVFIRRVRSPVCGTDNTGRLRVTESRPHGSLNYFYWAFLPGVLWPIILISWIWVRIWFISESSHVCILLSLPRKILAERLIGSWHHLLWGDVSSLFELQRAFLHMCSQGGLFNFENEEYVIFYLLSGQGLASSIILLMEFLSSAGYCSAQGPSISGLTVVKNPPSNSRDSGLFPGQGTKVSLDTEQLSLHHNKRSMCCN